MQTDKEVSGKNSKRKRAQRSEHEGQKERESTAIISPHKNVFVLAADVMNRVKALPTRAQQQHTALSAFTPTCLL